MNDHYYTESPSSQSRPAEARFDYRGRAFTLISDAGVFSRGELDSGTRILLSALPDRLQGRVLDLGCGWGPVGVALGALYPDCQIVFTDVNLRALSLAEQNAKASQVTGTFIQSDGFAGIDGMFDYIITNPPIRAGKETIYRMFADSAAHLNPNGQLYLVIRKQQGAPSALKYLSTLFVSAEVIEKSGGYWQRHHDVTIAPEQTYMLPCVVTGLKLAARAFTKPGDAIVLMPPVYGPFRQSIVCNHRKPAAAPLVSDAQGRYSMDYAAIEAQLKSGSRCVFLCNPHNPVSRAWSREELQRLLNLCLAYQAVLVSDEIHADFVYEPNHFVSALTLEGNEQCVLALAAASKTFNVPGLQQAMAMSHNAQLLAALKEEGECAGVTSGNSFALPATQAAYTECDDWLRGLKDYLEESRSILTRAVPQLLPRAVLSPIEATCLCWLDLRAYAPTCEELQRRVKKHHLVLNDGTFFDETLGQGFLRLNFACPHARLLEGLKRLAEAMNDPE